ncbi:aliphatic nitrilase [Fusarium coicis]|nr:aliphatic nitrilase [Fusarium coicis]
MDANPTPNLASGKQNSVRVYVVQRCPRLLDLEHGVQTAIEESATAAKGGANQVNPPSVDDSAALTERFLGKLGHIEISTSDSGDYPAGK